MTPASVVGYKYKIYLRRERCPMRRVAAFCLILCVLLALLAPASAEEVQFVDSGKIENRSEVTLMVSLGLISGYAGGTFQPDRTVSRAEAAKLIALLCTDDPTGGEGQFSDLDGCWATDYILYCAGRGIISGSGGLFRPEDSVTGRELAKMLLVVVGSDPARYTGTDWSAAVDADAMEYGIYAHFNQDPGAPVSRDNACLLIYNAVQCLAIAGYDADGAPVYAVDELMNPITYLEQRFGVARYTSVLTGNEYADLTAEGGKLEEGLSKIAGHKEFAVSTDLSLVGRCVDVYVQNGQVIGTPCASASFTSYTFTSAAGLEQLCRLTGYSLAEDADYYYNYDPSTGEILDQLTGSEEIIVLDRNGDFAFDQVLVLAFVSGTVESEAPLRVRLDGGSTVSALAFQSGDHFQKGQTVQCIQVNGQWFVK